jgi:cytochrome c biogenesis protein CcmG/thiol:disulfide interchange protein DsbE
MRRLLFLMPVAGFLLVGGYFAYSLRPGHDPRLLPSALIDKPVSDFDLPALRGDGRVSRAALAGAPALINIWASWCGPCRIEHPILMRLGATRGVRLVGIAYKDKPEDSARFLAELGDPFQAVGVDRDGRTGLDFGVYGVPETYVVDRGGRVRLRHVGPLTAQIVDRDILPLLRRLTEP